MSRSRRTRFPLAQKNQPVTGYRKYSTETIRKRTALAVTANNTAPAYAANRTPSVASASVPARPWPQPQCARNWHARQVPTSLALSPL